MFGDLPGGPLVKTLPFSVGGMGSIPGWGAKIPHDVWPKKKKKKKKNPKHKTSNVVTNPADFKYGPH